jgi:hypothetical protein
MAAVYFPTFGAHVLSNLPPNAAHAALHRKGAASGLNLCVQRLETATPPQ